MTHIAAAILATGEQEGPFGHLLKSKNQRHVPRHRSSRHSGTRRPSFSSDDFVGRLMSWLPFFFLFAIFCPFSDLNSPSGLQVPKRSGTAHPATRRKTGGRCSVGSRGTTWAAGGHPSLRLKAFGSQLPSTADLRGTDSRRGARLGSRARGVF